LDYLAPSAQAFLAFKKKTVDHEVNIFQRCSALPPFLDVPEAH